MRTDQQPIDSRAANGAGTPATGTGLAPAETHRTRETSIAGPPGGAVGDALALLLGPGAVAELRAIGRDGRVASGYFDDFALLAEKADALDASGEHAGIYVTLNPVAPALLARRANRVVPRLGGKDATTADGDVLRRRWLPIDIDPVRPSGISATDGERAAAFAVAAAIRESLRAEGWPAPVEADSGNGAHLLYRVDLPNDADATALVRSVLAALDRRFSMAEATVDTANHNAARIWKLYGTVGRKGDPVPGRPHRRAAIVAAPREVAVVPEDLLRSLAGPAPRPAPPAPPGGDAGFDLRAWLEGHGIAVASEKPWQGGTLYDLTECPFSDAHRGGAYAIRFPDGGVHAACHHDSCGGGRQRWSELRERFEPGRPGPNVSSAPPAPAADPDAAADGILAKGDPLQFFLDSFARDHVGDVTLARCLVMSIASQSVRNSNGLHVYVTGESGKGKSSGMTAMLRQVPEEYRLAERMSNKALYYSDDISPGTVLLLDDIALSDELQEVLKEATTRFDEPVRHRAVDRDRRVRRYSIPERCVWWLANVQALYDDQVLNRMLSCWVDDSAEQDAEVCRRQLAEDARPAGEAVAERFDLAVCQALWRRLRAEGTVFVEVPFATRIRFDSVRNRRNPRVLVDLVRSHALLFCRQREQARLADGGLVVTATKEDFRYATGVFESLHATGGSLEAKLDRNEAQVLALAAKNGVERFTIADVQEWTGWQYYKVYRLLLGRESRGTRYPGLLDRSPALGLRDQTAGTVDEEGREVRQRQYVFVFDRALHLEQRPAGLVWLEEEPAGDGGSSCHGCHGVAHENGGECAGRSGNGGLSPGIDGGTCHDHDRTGMGEETPGTPAAGAADSVPPGVASTGTLPVNPPSIGGSGTGTAPDRVATPVANARHLRSDREEVLRTVDPRAFIAFAEPTFEPCSACGKRPSHHREKWRKGMTERRRLCAGCYGAVVRRAQAALEPLPRVIAPEAMERAPAPVGRCDVCDLEPAAYAGGGVRLCRACRDRELRRAVREGGAVVGE